MSFRGSQTLPKAIDRFMALESCQKSIVYRSLSGARRSRINTASLRARKRQEKKKQQLQTPEKRSEDALAAKQSTGTVEKAASPSSEAVPGIQSQATNDVKATVHQFLQKYVLPVRFRSQRDDEYSNFYTRQHALAAAQRFPLWLLLAAFLSLDETNPYSTIRITGPSMLPTCSPDGSEIYLKSAWHKTIWYKALQFLFPSYMQPSYQVGDVVGLSHPDYLQHVSCKRVVGVAGDSIQRYGQYVHLFEAQDPVGLGITWPQAKDKVHSWIDPLCPWDEDDKGEDDTGEQKKYRRTVVVPQTTLWVEGDCPGLAIDSRQYGPVPLEWIQGKIIRRLWPIWRKPGELPYRTRPHPIPLDDETLEQYNVHRIMPTAAALVDEEQ